MTRKLARPELCVRIGYAMLFLIVPGCGEKGPDRFELSGKVTYRGKPVPAGTITFEPTDRVVNATTIGEAEIKDGQYKTLPDKGVVGGAAPGLYLRLQRHPGARLRTTWGFGVRNLHHGT